MGGGVFDVSTPPTTNMHDSLAGGIKRLSNNQTVTFKQYQKYILPADGFVYWVATDTAPFTVEGAFHYVVQQSQEVDQTRGINTVIFSALESVTQFNAVASGTLWIGTIPADMDNQGAPVLFSFNQRGSYFQEADEHHYTGTAVWPTMQTQILQSVADLPTSAILSNSIPLFLSLTGPQPGQPAPSWLPTAQYTLYPEYLAAENQVPPFITVEVKSTESLQIQAYRYNRADGTAGRDQLVKDQVTLHIWGLDHVQATQYLDYLMWYFETYGGKVSSMGLMSDPVIRDAVSLQTELNTRAQKKVIELTVSYYQSAALASAMKLIEKTQPAFSIGSAETVDFVGAKVPPDPFPAA